MSKDIAHYALNITILVVYSQLFLLAMWCLYRAGLALGCWALGVVARLLGAAR